MVFFLNQQPAAPAAPMTLGRSPQDRSAALLEAMKEELFQLESDRVKSKISQHEKQWLDLPWQKVRDSVEVKLYAHENELYVLAKSKGRQQKEIAMRRRKLVRLLLKLRAMRHSLPSRDQLLLRIGAAKKEAGRAFGFVNIPYRFTTLPSRERAARTPLRHRLSWSCRPSFEWRWA